MIVESIYILPISIGLQFTAAFFAFRLIQTTTGGKAWAFIAAALFLMGVRRSISFYQILQSGSDHAASNAELVALLISALMVAGVALIGPLFTATRRTEKELHQSEHHARSVEEQLYGAIENISEGFVLFDAEGRLVICNSRYKEFYGYSDEDIHFGIHTRELGRLDLERGTVTLVGTVGDYIERRESNRKLLKTFIVHLKNGRILETRDRKTASGGIVSIQEDVTERELARQTLQEAHDELERRVEERTIDLSQEVSERKHAEEKAIGASRAKSDLLANMSHELRTPLNAIIGFSDTIREETYGPIGNDKYQEYMDDIHHSGQHLLELINDILDVSSIEAGAMELYEENVSLLDVVDASIRIVNPRADIGKVTINSSIDPDTPLIFLDERRGKQIFLNLLSNAIKFTHEGGRVSVSSRLNCEGSLAITVSDNGIGMDEVEVTKALSAFGQVDSGLDRKHEGAGLGLPLTKGLMELHGGTLKVKSEKGHGTSITVTFPKKRVGQNVR